MKKCWDLICSLLHIALLITTFGSAHAVATDLPEIHLLVDVSASMKRTDPQNLRINSVKMFNYLANQKAKMSLGVFSTDYKEIIPLQLVSPEYQNLFAKNSNEIRSDGHWTNLVSALNAANQNWGNGKKIIILLTDGKLDLGSEQLNTQSRHELNSVTIPSLQQNNIQVYTIGLSNQSDKELLSNLSLKTNALSQTVVSADDLDGILYAIFTAAINYEGAPLSKNKDSSRTIKIDPSIHEFTLIFKKNSVITNLYLSTPNGKKSALEKENNGILATPHYEIIKIKYPLPGDWILSGPEQEMERVLILTDVGLGTNFATGVYFNSELLSLTGYLVQGLQQITSDMAVDNMKMKFELKNAHNKFSYFIPYDKNGAFHNEFILNVPKATYKAIWSVESSYLSRESQFMAIIQDSPFEQSINKAHDALMIRLLNPELIKTDSTKIKILYKNTMRTVPMFQDRASWVFDLYSLCQEPSFSEDDVLIEISALTTGKRSLLFRQLLIGKLCSANAKPLVIAQTQPPKTTSKTEEVPPPKKEPLKNNINKNFNYLFLIFVLLLITIAFAFVVLLGLRYRKKLNKIREELL